MQLLTDQGLWGLFISAFISATIAPGGSEAVIGYMASTGNYADASLLFSATIGNTLGALTTWGMGLAAAKKYPVTKLLSTQQQKALKIIKSRGLWTLFFSWLPLIGDALCFAGGWLKLPLLTAFWIILIGKFCRYWVIVSMFN